VRLHPAWIVLLFVPVARAAGPFTVEGDPTAAPPPGYERRTTEGFIVYVNKAVFQQPRDRWGRPPFSVLERELSDLRRLLAPMIVTMLQRKVPVWVEWDEPLKDRPDGHIIAMARYRLRPQAEGWGDQEPEKRTEEWRQAMQRLNPKAGSIEVCSLRLLGEARRPGPGGHEIVMLHEVAHAVHDRLLGWDHPDVRAAYQQAVDRRLYDDVTDRYGRRCKAYARTNEMEYFAEISCAYLDLCNYFPFNYSQLQSYDPAGFAVVERVWRQPERFQRGVKAAVHDRAVFIERAAQLRLDQLKSKAKDGTTDELKKALNDLVRAFPDTAAADEARRQLSSLD
jgi:hypothetical protein